MMIPYSQGLDQRKQGTVGLKLKLVSELNSLERRARFNSPLNQSLLSRSAATVFSYESYI